MPFGLPHWLKREAITERRRFTAQFTMNEQNEPQEEEKKPAMATTVSELITFIQAAHVSQDTDWCLDARGGIMLVAYPEQLKTTILSAALRRYPEAQLVSDMNVREFSDIREDLLTARYDSIGFLDYQKVWERDERTSANVEGVIRSLTDEGWNGSLGGKQMKGAPAKCFMVLAMTPNLYNAKQDAWRKTGFSRRFLVLNYTFKDRRILESSIKEGRKVELSIQGSIPRPVGPIRYAVTEAEAEYIGSALKEQRGLVALTVLLRVYNTLKWYFDEVRGETDGAMALLMNMVPLMMPEGGILTLDEPAKKPQLVEGRARRSRKTKVS